MNVTPMAIMMTNEEKGWEVRGMRGMNGMKLKFRWVKYDFVKVNMEASLTSEKYTYLDQCDNNEGKRRKDTWFCLRSSNILVIRQRLWTESIQNRWRMKTNVKIKVESESVSHPDQSRVGLNPVSDSSLLVKVMDWEIDTKWENTNTTTGDDKKTAIAHSKTATATSRWTGPCLRRSASSHRFRLRTPDTYRLWLSNGKPATRPYKFMEEQPVTGTRRRLQRAPWESALSFQPLRSQIQATCQSTMHSLTTAKITSPRLSPRLLLLLLKSEIL